MLKKYFVFLALCSCLVSFTACSTNDLDTLRQNYIHLVMKSENNSDELIEMLSQVAPEKEVSDRMVVELQERYPLDADRITHLMQSLDANGQWADINYADNNRSAWEPKLHAERLLLLAKAYRSKRMDHLDEQVLSESIHKGLNFWFTSGLVCPNWWYNEIGIPKTLGSVFMLFEDQLTPDEKKQAIREMAKAQIGMTGQNKVWLAGNVLVRGLLENDAALVKEARDAIAAEISIGQGEGIQPDWSFHQHGPQQQFGNYGLAFIGSMGFYSGLFTNTSLQLNDEQLDLLSGLLEQGYRWVLWRGYMDTNSLNRHLFHNAPIDKSLIVAFAASDLAETGNPHCIAVAQEILADNYFSKPLTNGLTGHKHFFSSDMTIHRTDHWMASLKMASNRIIGTELVNEDNLKGFYMADGALYTYVNGDEYLNILPFWDWRKIPGITSYESNEAIPTHQDEKQRNQSDYVGGITDGNIGFSVMELNRDGINAYKAWIFSDEFIFAAGAGICADTALNLTTTIDQRLKQDEVWTCTSSGEWVKTRNREVFSENTRRFFHDKTGYVIAGGDPCIVHNEMRSGQWLDLMGIYAPNMLQDEVVSIHLDHGIRPDGASYGYYILPATDRAFTADFDPGIVQITHNTPDAQVFFMPSKGVWFASVRKPLELKLDDTNSMLLEKTGLYIFRAENNAWVKTFEELKP